MTPEDYDDLMDNLGHHARNKVWKQAGIAKAIRYSAGDTQPEQGEKPKKPRRPFLYRTRRFISLLLEFSSWFLRTLADLIDLIDEIIDPKKSPKERFQKLYK